MINLFGKKILVTGATGSIGYAISNLLKELGSYLYLSGTNDKKLSDIKKELGEQNCTTIKCDLSSSSEILSMMKAIDKIDAVVCNAGITKDNLSIRMTDQDFQDVIDINLKANFIINRESIKKMLKQKHGNIVNISSVVGISGNPGQSNYAASKSGMIAMGKSLALEVARKGININMVAPGFIESNMTDKLPDVYKESILGKIPQKRFGKAIDVANIVAFLVSPLSSYITGQTFHVNGGMLMP
ncbi:MAG: SDR family oxidoreductase [Rickettsia sp.]|nr:SDR family oxidoreductase [Rickettsia sp.]